MGGKFSLADQGNRKCEDCPKGKYQNMKGQDKCEKCPKGFYQEDTGEDNCMACTVGKRAADLPGTGAGHSTKDAACLPCNTETDAPTAISFGKDGVTEEPIFKAICDAAKGTFDGAGEVCSCAPGSRGIAVPIATGVGGFALGFGGKYAFDRLASVAILAALLTMVLAAAAAVLALRQRRRQQVQPQVELHKQDIRSA